MFKNLILILLVTILSGSTFRTTNTVEEFHSRIIGTNQVKDFKAKFPYIVNNREVYIAYLQRYYIGHENEFIALME